MENKKRRILWVGESSNTLSGYGIYSREILNRLHNTGKFIIAEFASYGTVNNPKENAPWIYYANTPQENDSRFSAYNSNPVNQFGQWRFERVLLDFKADLVLDARDVWMSSWQNSSPLRPYFHWTLCPTIDSSPMQDDWVQSFIEADGMFTWTDWTNEVFKKEGGGHMKLQSSAPAGVDINVFRPVNNKAQIRQSLGIPPNANIIGSVMRNQKRKLYPDLIISLEKFIQLCREKGNNELANNTYLLIHTSYPDMGWDIPVLLRESSVSHRVLFSYVCRECNHFYVSHFQDARTVCPRCNRSSAVLPSVVFGVNDVQLASLYQCMDVYVQYAICEGFGMPQIEAASCGVPVMAVDGTAMSDVVRKLEGFPLKCRAFRELETGAYRYNPDNDYLAQTLYDFLIKPDAIRSKYGIKDKQII